MKSLLTLLTALYAALPAVAQIHPADMQGPRVVIVYEQTSFKKQLVAEMKKMLSMSGADITLIIHGQDKDLDENPAGYDVVFITNSGVNSMVRPWITEWLKTHKGYARKMILHTTQRSDWEVETVEGVDAVTSASAEEKVRELALEYTGRIMKKLMPAPPPRPAAE